MVDAASTIHIYFINEIDICWYLPHIQTYIRPGCFLCWEGPRQ